MLNINFETRLKPLVLLYEPTASRENPTTVDLSSGSQLTILRAIPRAELSQEITDYFHIKRWTGYFIQSSMRTVREDPSS